MEIHIAWGRGFQTDLALGTACCSNPCCWQGWQLELLVSAVTGATDSNGGCQHWLCMSPTILPILSPAPQHLVSPLSPSTRMPTISFLILPQPYSFFFFFFTPFPPISFSAADQHWQCTSKSWLWWQKMWDTACVQASASQLSTCLCNTEQFECQQ